MTLLASGDRVNDRLVIDRLLGEGAFAEVHRVRHDFLGWQAMKLFKRVASAEETHEMLGEARLLSTLGHPNIIRVFDAGTVRTSDGLRGFFTMEYIPGGSLERLTSAYPRGVPTDLAIEVFEQVAAGLAVAHSQTPPVLHRDITPANILVGYDDTGMRIRLSDFGLAQRADPFTMLASAQGTYAFMAPEVLRYEGCSPASDVWSVGMVAYWLLTNHLPYDDGQPFSSYSPARFNRKLLPPSKYNDEVDAELDQILLDTLRPDPGERLSSAVPLVDALRERRARLRNQDRSAAAVRHGPGDSTPPSTEAGLRRAEQARALADEALALSRMPGHLDRAADLMEEAVNLSPEIRQRYLERLLLWRRGVVI